MRTLHAKAMAVLARGAGGERGAATAEYALILALVAIALIASLTSLEGALSDQLSDIVSEITGSG